MHGPRAKGFLTEILSDLNLQYCLIYYPYDLQFDMASTILLLLVN